MPQIHCQDEILLNVSFESEVGNAKLDRICSRTSTRGRFRNDVIKNKQMKIKGPRMRGEITTTAKITNLFFPAQSFPMCCLSSTHLLFHDDDVTHCKLFVVNILAQIMEENFKDFSSQGHFENIVKTVIGTSKVPDSESDTSITQSPLAIIRKTTFYF